jgi:hypothetical protein
MRQSFVSALVLCTAAAFAPQQHSARGAVNLYSSVKPTAGISFYEGLYEPDVPDVKLTRWRASVLQNVTTPSTRNVVTGRPVHAVAAQVKGRRERRRDVQLRQAELLQLRARGGRAAGRDHGDDDGG